MRGNPQALFGKRPTEKDPAKGTSPAVDFTRRADRETRQEQSRQGTPVRPNRDELTGVDVCVGGWDIRSRWFGVVVGATPRLGELRRGETIPWRVIAAQIAPRERRGSR